MSSGSSPIPLYHQVNMILRQRVADGTYAPGSRLSPEDDLASEFGVSRATIRQAVAGLVEAGIVARMQGRGTFVLDAPHGSLGQAFSGNLGELISEVNRSKIASVDIEQKAKIPPPIAEQLHLDPPTGTVVRRIRTMDGQAFAYTVNFLPAEIGKGLTKASLKTSGLMQLLGQKKIKISSARQTIRAELADPVVSESLDLPLGAAVLFVERLLFDPAGTPVEFVQSWYHGELYEYTVTFGRGEDGLESKLA